MPSIALSTLARMEPVEIRPCTVAEIEEAPNIAALLAEYASESSTLGAPNPQYLMYRQMEALGICHALGAFQGDTLVGFIVLLNTMAPHFGVVITTSESLFVMNEARKGGTGMKLLSSAKESARKSGSAGLFISAPKHGRLAQVLEHRSEFVETNRVFFCPLKQETLQ